MPLIKWIVIVLLIAAVAAVAAGRAGLLEGQAPTTLGVRDGRLAPPRTTPNSVSSQAQLHAGHAMREQAAIAAFRVTGNGAATLARLRTLLNGLPEARIVTSTPDYLYVQFRTPVMRFVDDVEFWHDPARNVIDVRSASRLGRHDLGRNRERIEALRQLLATP